MKANIIFFFLSDTSYELKKLLKVCLFQLISERPKQAGYLKFNNDGGSRTHIHLVRKRTFNNYLAKLTK